MYHYGLIGNCNISALISKAGGIDWLCLPRPDSEPTFGSLLDPEGGTFTIQLADMKDVQQNQTYLENTNILITEMRNSTEAIRVIDFAPRFEQYGRMYCPTTVIRIVEPILGTPNIRVTCRPVSGWEKEPIKATRGNSHLRYEIRNELLRITTNMPITYLEDETPFRIEDKLYFGISWGTAIEEDLQQVSERFLQLTESYWKTWVKHCSIPTLFQKETIRSALALKLHCYEDTGAILAATTTSLPEQLGKNRNWDYRFCWLRDAFFVLSAFRNLGHFEEMEGFLKFLLNVAHQKDHLAPVYSLSQSPPIPEMTHSNWGGYQGSSPVRSNNQAAEHIQNDVYGEMILTLTPIYLDQRFSHLRHREHEQLLSQLGKLAARSISSPDAGLWEIRNGQQEHTFTNLLCWAGLDRIKSVQNAGYISSPGFNLDEALKRAETSVSHGSIGGILQNGPGDPTLDASLAIAPILRFPNRDICEKTVNAILANLKFSDDAVGKNYFYRYKRSDDFGTPDAPFLVCSFWLVQALASLNRKEEAHEILDSIRLSANSLGLYSEHYSPLKEIQLGNFPQAYSHVGLINSAFSVSPPWESIL